jgi:large subunit ribosomal protein L19
MSNSIKYKDTQIQVGDTITVDYRIKEADGKERIQQFQGILISIKGNTPETRMFTVRKMSKSGIGVERIFPVASPFIAAIRMDKKSTFQKAKLYFLKNLSDQALRQKLYKQKKPATKRHAVAKKSTIKSKSKKAE